MKFSPETRLSGLFILDTAAGPITVEIMREQGQRLHTDPGTAHDALPALLIGGTFHAALIAAEVSRWAMSLGQESQCMLVRTPRALRRVVGMLVLLVDGSSEVSPSSMFHIND